MSVSGWLAELLSLCPWERDGKREQLAQHGSARSLDNHSMPPVSSKNVKTVDGPKFDRPRYFQLEKVTKKKSCSLWLFHIAA